ncbi:glutathione S-transferase [Peptoniphilus ivorii]|uniref:glutathione S-transferase N-terminal domain-containing protein n=1 Tax=Aedoeadaptatus ivorii TaxID=54006 RepID=UPI002787004B|nr:glutathione S-transferase N-terminal domain-containing protein [Peptoniphilus ivorii]MDQ0509092.1 glutathione S-transferase [Peptoniphilus ivorii]
MKLYYAPGTCALSVWISLEWAGADYEVERVELGSDEYKKINPLGAVPALDSGDGNIKTQANAILQYIADMYPEADLGPDESPEDRFLFNERAAF